MKPWFRQSSEALRPHEIVQLIRQSGLRPTRQRVQLGQLLFADGNRHATAEGLHDDAVRAGVEVSLATVYNTLRKFTSAGLVKELAIVGAKSFFDTNRYDHGHFYLADSNELVDIPPDTAVVGHIPAPPPGFDVEHVDVVVRLRKHKCVDAPGAAPLQEGSSG